MRYPLKNWQKIKRGYQFGEKTFYSSFHLGTDYIVPEGTPVYAPHDCKIVKVGNFPEGGRTIHASFFSRGYCQIVMRFMHLSKYPVPGKYKGGEIIGRTGNTGKLTRGAHLHLDISRKVVAIKNHSNFIDPEEFFSRSRGQTLR